MRILLKNRCEKEMLNLQDKKHLKQPNMKSQLTNKCKKVNPNGKYLKMREDHLRSLACTTMN